MIPGLGSRIAGGFLAMLAASASWHWFAMGPPYDYLGGGAAVCAVGGLFLAVMPYGKDRQ